MKSFSILEKETDIHRHILLQASAGTGKTFTIEHLVMRLLLSDSPLTFDQILVVTFTKKATAELVTRLYSCLQKCIAELKSGAKTTPYLQDMPDEKRAIRNLEAALTSYTELQVFTIHGFCEKCLKEGRFLFEEESFPTAETLVEEEDIRQVIRDYFRTALSKEEFSIHQLKRVGAVEERLYQLMQQGREIVASPPLSDAVKRFQAFMQENPQPAEELLEECLQLAPLYKKINDRSGKLHSHHRQSLCRFTALFANSSWGRDDFEVLLQDGLPFVTLFLEENLKSKAVAPVTRFSSFREKCKRELLPLVQEAIAPAAILSRMGRECQKMLQAKLEKEEKFRFDDLLLWMKEAVSKPLFAEEIRKRYKAVIIDEFQDTDPLQWSIFRDLFFYDPERRSHMYLVGDPKQSIYAFRQADIYTYLDAKETIGEISSLDTNFRSTPALVASLNHLFSLPHLLPLPKISSYLPYYPVKAGREQGKEEALHCYFFEGECNPKELEEKVLFPAITKEILSVKAPLSSWAILVRDRFQADRFAAFCNKLQLPYTLQRKRKLNESIIYDAMHDLLLVLLYPRDLKALKRLLGGPLIGEDHLFLEQMKEDEELSATFMRFEQFRKIVEEKGLTAFFKAFLEEITLSSEQISDFMQLIDLLAPFGKNISQALQFMQKGEEIECEESAVVEGVQILTIHASKGLEFDYVFPVGLMIPSREQEDFIPDESQKLLPVIDKEDIRYLRYLEECEAERMRQFYVACTRAREKLYLYLPSFYLSHFNQDSKALTDWLQKDPGTKVEWLKESKTPSPYILEPLQQEVTSTKLTHFSFPVVPVVSFTSLHKKVSVEVKLAPHDFSVEEKTIANLPAGKEIGLILHKLLEKLPEIPSRELLHFATKGTAFVGWEEVIYKLVEKALTTPLTLGEESLILSKISEKDCYKEMEFFYQDEAEKRFVKGVIDLLFCYKGKIYLLDWKSNWLPNYSQEALQAEMEEHHYIEQARLYKEACERYFSLFTNYSFGGVIYFFLRGGTFWFSPK